jgi:proline dehydrogenase
MLRSIFLYLSQANWARQIITRWRISRKAASRFIAGEKLEDAFRVIKSLNEKSINATLDHLGEHTSNPEKALIATDEIIDILERVDREGVSSNVSIKLTQIGLAVDEDLCAENLDKIISTAAELKTFVRIDMEDSPWVEKTLNLFQMMQGRYSHQNVGIVIQSYLYRSVADVSMLLESGSKIRLCKGAYDEPDRVAYPKKADVDANFDQITEQLIEGSLSNGTPEISEDGKIPPIPAIATHDEQRVVFARNHLEKTGFPKRAVEFQMLHGIRRDLQQILVEEGFPVRVYVPYGREWYPYYLRRLAERPANLWFLLSNLFR